jgi:predicted ATPase
LDVPWRIQLLGALRVEHGGHAVTHFRTQKTAALLARLALFPRRAHSREELIDLLWPDADLDAGRNRLRVAIAALRRQLETPDAPDSVLIADRNVIRLDPAAFRCDVTEFEETLTKSARASTSADEWAALGRAAALYHGELLPGFYDDWIVEERERLGILYEDLCERRQKIPPTERGANAPERLIDIPPQFTRFFGRERECGELIELLREGQTRLVTLSGPGGTGKTRLAVEVAQRMAETVNGPVSFVPLADLTDASLISQAIADRLGLPAVAGQDPLNQVVTALAEEQGALLVLDNFEQLVERGAPLVLSLLTRLPSVTCLVTSRRRLKLPGEQEYPVPPLPLPQKEDTLERVNQAASAQLFVDRARAARPDFRLTTGNAVAVAALCRRLEGIPLALELVASRSLVLTPAQMTERLSECFDLLSTSQPGWDKRHQSLWAAMAWSYDLIPPPLQRFFDALSVFRGGFTIETASVICEEPQALEYLTQLRERSLAVVEEGATGLRFRLLETLREFAAEHLSPGERRDLARRHAKFYEALAAELGALPYGPKRDAVLQMLDAEIDNLRAALAFCQEDVEDAGVWDAETGLRLAGWLGDYWATRGLLREGLAWLEGALERSGPGGAQGRALTEAGWLAASQGNYDRAEAAFTHAVRLARDRDDAAALALALRRHGTMCLWRGDNPQAAVDLQEALLLARESGIDADLAAVLNGLGVLAEQGYKDDARARELYEESLMLFRRVGDQQRASYCLHNLGNIAHNAGDEVQAEALLRESLAITEALGDLWNRAYCLRSLGDVLIARGDPSGAIKLLEEGRTLCRRLGDRMSEAGTVCSLALVARNAGDVAQAKAFYEEAQALYGEMDHTVGATVCRVDLAELAVSQGEWAEAADLLAGADCEEALSFGDLRVRAATVREAIEAAQA